MDERYDRLHTLFDGARELTADERARFLDEGCGDDQALRAEVLELLAAHEAGEGAAFGDAAIDAGREALEGLLGRSRAETTWMPPRIGPYRLLRKFAQGGMGVVYEAEEDAPRRRVALKVVHPLHVTPERLRRFRQETELLGRLEHPGIARIYSAGTFDAGSGEQPYIAMELVDGDDLGTHVERRKLGVNERLALLADVCDAVQHAHEKGVVHRDLKPDNVLVDGRGQPKVLDFGVARASEGSTLLTTMVTAEGDLLGTIAYMAPEQLDGWPGAVTPRSDVYALGAIAFELLVGRLPHDVIGLPLTAAMSIVRDGEPPRLGKLRPELAGDVETVVGKALEKEPARRYASAAALADDLRAILEHRPIAARPPSRTYRLRKFARRNKALVGGSATTLAAILVGLVASLTFAVRAANNAEIARANERRAVAGVLQATQDALEQGDLWRAARTFRRAPPAHDDWTWNLLARALPRMVPEELGQGTVVWLDDDHLAAAAPDGDGAVVLDARSMRAVGRLLPGRGVRPMGLGKRPYHGWWVEGDPPRRAFRISPETWEVAARYELPAPAGCRYQGTVVATDGTARHVYEDLEASAALVFDEAGEVVSIPLPPVFWTERQRVPYSLTPSPDGEVLAALNRPGILLTFDLRTGEPLGELDGLRRSTCPVVQFLPGARELLTYDAEQRLVAVDLASHEIARRYESVPADSCSSGWLSDDGALYATGLDGQEVEVHELATGRRVFARRVGLGTGHQAVFSPDGTRLRVSAQDRGACVIDLVGDELRPEALASDDDPRATTYRGHEQYVYHLALSPDGRLAASSSVMEPAVRLWDLATGRTLATLERPASRNASILNRGQLLAFSPDGRRLFATARPGLTDAPRLLVWDLLTGGSRAENLPGEASSDSHFAWLDHAPELLGLEGPMRLGRKAILREDGRAYGMQQPTLPKVPVGERWDVFRESNEDLTLDLSPDLARVVIGTWRSTRVYDRATGRELASFPGQTYAVAWSPNGRSIAAGGEDGRIRIIDAELQTELVSFRAHDDYVFSLAWTADGTRLVSASGDTTVRVWDPRRSDEREADARAYMKRLAPLRGLSREELEARFDAATDIAERGAIVRTALERRGP